MRTPVTAGSPEGVTENMRFAAIASVTIIVLAAAATWLLHDQFAADGVELGFHGTFAMFLCLALVPAVAVGLMRLMHISDRRGYDERADTVARRVRHHDEIDEA